MSIELLNMDCMDYLRECEDNAFELAIVDPPYGIGMGNVNTRSLKIKTGDWDSERPGRNYFEQLFRVSCNQVIWGGNYFADILPVSAGWVFWDKKQSGNQQRGEMAWTSLGRIEYFCREWYFDRNWQTERIHPTQKPIKLYEWLLQNYANEGDRILDTHLGSGSSAIAAHYGGFDFVGIELDEDYYRAACERFDKETAQEALF